MNEPIFLLHTFVVVALTFLALRLGQQGLSAWIMLLAVLANLFVRKQMVLFGFHVTCSDVHMIGSVLGLNLLQEYYGREAARTTSWICLFCMVSFTLMTQFHLHYFPSLSDTTHTAYLLILEEMPRILIASIISYFVVQRFDIALFAFLKTTFLTRSLSFRIAVCMVTSQLLDTVLFSMLGLWGLVESLVDIMIVSYTIKLLIILGSTPLIIFSKHFYKKKEHVTV